MDPLCECMHQINRRQFFGRSAFGIGAAALGAMLQPRAGAAAGALGGLHKAPRAKRVIYLFQNGGPSQIDLFDYKPLLRQLHGTELPASIRMGQRITGMTSGQDSLPVVASKYQFAQHGQSGIWMSELLPNLARAADDLCMITTVNTEAINHDPGVTYIQTGSQQPGRPGLGAWLSYGLGSENSDLPAFIVLISKGGALGDNQGLFQRLWGAGFLPSQHQGVYFRAANDPVLYLGNPPGIDRQSRREMLDGLGELNRLALAQYGDPEIDTRIQQFEMAYRMQASVPDLMDTSTEPDSVFDLYGPDARKPGTFAANCLLARRLAERDVRFIQLYHRGWDHHGNLPRDIELQARDVDRPCYGLLTDLKQRGLLDDTLIIWGGEFGRTTYCQGEIQPDNYGRDHHGRCFSMWMAGGGVKPGSTYGETDDFSYNIVRDPMHVHDLNATLLHLLGVDHERLTFKYQGRDYRLTDVHGQVVNGVLG